MRKVVGAIALLFLLAFLVLLIPFPSAPPAAQGGKGGSAPDSILLRSAEIADAGGARVALLRLSVFSDSPRNLSAFCSDKPIQQSVLILDFPHVPGTDKGIASSVAAALSRSGISSRTASAQDAFTSQNAIIISCSGAIPLPLLENASQLQQANSRAVSLISLSGKTINENGSLAPLNASLPKNFDLVGLPADGTIDALAELVALSVFLSGGQQAHAAASGNLTLAIPINSSSAYCRVALDAGAGKYRFADSGLLQAAPGSLSGPSRITDGRQAEFEFSLLSDSEVGRTLRFFAAAYSASGLESQREIAGGKISQGWASRFYFSFPHGGKYALRVLDQFGRAHASAFVQVPKLDASQVSAEGSRYEFFILLDGEPANGAITARLDNGTPKNYSVQGGRLVIWSAPAPGSHALHFDLSGTGADYAFVAQQSGLSALFDTYLRFGIPAAFFLLAIFLLLRAGRLAKYSITFHEAAQTASEIVEVTSRETLVAYSSADLKFGGFSLPCYPDEIAAQLGKVPINPQSMLRVLRKLVQQGVFAEHESAFVPKNAMGGFSAGELAALRTIHECMLEQGFCFSRKPVITVKRGVLELALFRGKKSVLAKIGKACRAVVFQSAEAQQEFEQELLSPDSENNRIMLALSNDSVIFTTASRQALYSVLP